MSVTTRISVLLITAAGMAAPGDAQQAAIATLVPSPPNVDGVLDEAFWATIEPITEFLQRDPVDGAPASERTEVRIAYDENGIYFGFTLFDSEPQLIRRSILQRGGRIDKDDRVVIALDTYHDRRNGYIFEIGALGTQDDALFSDESMSLDDWSWDGVYSSESRVTEDGWVLEVAIPFTTIRFSEAAAPRMGLAFQRSIRRKNENVYWPHIGQEYRAGISQVSRYATLDGLQNLRRGRHIEVKPFVIGGGQKRAGDIDTEIQSDVGLDVKYAITSNVALDLTLNTDFAQVEADNVQINLTRFNLFFPEKREFFLERAGLFQFGAARQTEVFFSRRIGLDGDISGGGRITGQLGRLSLGALSLRTESFTAEDGSMMPAAWSSVARLRADVLPRTTMGGIITSTESPAAHNRVAGADLDTRFWSSSSLRFWTANVWDSDSPAGTSTYAAQAALVVQNDFYTSGLDWTRIGDGFAPGLGFVQRPDQVRWGGQLGVTPRFEQSTWARQLAVFARADRVAGLDGTKQSHSVSMNATFSTESGEGLVVTAQERFEYLESPARISGRTLPRGDYTFRLISGSARTNDSRTFSGNASWSFGDFWSGTRTALGGGLTWKTGPHLTLGGRVNWNDVSLPVPQGDFSTTLLSLDVQGAVSRKLFANALVQWDDVSNTLQANIRVDWIHTPGSDLFVVIDTGYLTGDLLDPANPRWVRRTGVVKLTYLKAL